MIEEVAVAIRTSGPRCRGDRVDDGCKVALGRSQRLLRSLSILNVRACTVPPDNVARVVTEGLSANQKPAIDSAMAADPGLNLARFSRAQLLLPFFHQHR